MVESWCSALNRAGFDPTGSPANSPWKDAFPSLQENEAGTYLAGARHREGLTQRHISEMENAKKLAALLNVDYRAFL